MDRQDEPEYIPNSPSDPDDQAGSTFFRVILSLYQSTGLLYGFDDGQPYTKKPINGDIDDGTERDTPVK
ncbi:hypothetical protein [Pantoea vagans]|uniref:hypothetical protein n=1 Tax=Pantoea vagans TaxID=470934 RepID=UPI00366E2639